MSSSPIQKSLLTRLMHHSSVWWIVGLIIVATFLLRSFPEIDLQIAALFAFDNKFPLSADPFWRGLRRLSINTTTLLVVFLLSLWIFRLLRPQPNERVSFSKLAFSTASLLLGPAIATNLIFKEFWGRPRPVHLETFGGDDTFILPWSFSDQCASNCSFVSGETSAALWFVTLIVFLPTVWHGRALVFVGFYTLLVSTLRIAFGGHFFSDVIFSILINGLIFWWTWGLFFERTSTPNTHPWATEMRASRGLALAGSPLRRLTKVISPPLLLAYSFVMNKVRKKS